MNNDLASARRAEWLPGIFVVIAVALLSAVWLVTLAAHLWPMGG